MAAANNNNAQGSSVYKHAFETSTATTFITCITPLQIKVLKLEILYSNVLLLNYTTNLNQFDN